MGRSGSKFTIGKYPINLMEIIKLFLDWQFVILQKESL